MANLIEIGKTIADETWGQVQEQKTERQEAFNLQLPENVVAKQDKDGNYSILQLSDKMMKKYGVLQDIVTQSSDEDALTKAQRILDDNGLPKEDITVECIGDLDYQVGYGVHVMFPWYKQYQDCYMYVKEVTNKWYSDGTFVSSLVLTPSRVMDEMDWEASNEDDTNESIGGGNSDIANKIIALARSFIGTPYVRGGNKPETGFDCSGLVQFCYNNYSEYLMCSLQRITETQCLQGQSVDKNNQGAWQVGDLIFFEGDVTYPPPGHVAILSKYENDKWWIIEAPRTGLNIREVELNRRDIHSVRRVIKEAQASETGSKVISTKAGLKVNGAYYTVPLIQYIEICEGFKAKAYYNKGWVIGFGFTYNSVPEAFNHGKSQNSNISKEKAEQILKKLLTQTSIEVNNYMSKNGVVLAPNQMDGLVSGVYLLGLGGMPPVLRAVVDNKKNGAKNNIQDIWLNCARKYGNQYDGRVRSDYDIFSKGIYKPYNS